MYHQLMKTTGRSKGKRCINGEGCLLLRQGKLNSCQERTGSNRWGDDGQRNSTGTAEPIPVKHRLQNQALVTPREDQRSQGSIQQRNAAGENQSWCLGVWRNMQ